MKFSAFSIQVQDGDIITSKKGFLQESPVTKHYYLVKKIRILDVEKGYCEVIGDKTEIQNQIKKLRND